jgi:uncharacterized membrane protein
VAIATALMPPLCTAGFGIATANWNYFLGAFYLFFINSVFISLATYLIVRYLHFPEEKFLNRRLEMQYRLWFTIIGVIILAPSTYFLYTLYQKEVIKKDIDQFVISPIRNEGNEILKWEVLDKDTIKLIKVYHSGSQLSDSLKNSIDSTLHKHKMVTYHLVPMRINLTKNEVSQLSAEMTKQMFQEMHLEEIKERSLVKQKSTDTLSYAQLFDEIKIAFPFVDTLSNGWLTLPDAASKIDTLPAVFYKAHRSVSKMQRNKLYEFLKVRLSQDTVVVIRR